MAIQRLAPDFASLTNLTGSVTDLQDDPDSPDGNWCVATGNDVGTIANCSFPTPVRNPTIGTGLQEIRVLVRKFSGTQTGTPTVNLQVYENGVFLLDPGGTSVTSAVGQIVSLPWDASLLTDPTGAGVEARVVGTQTGGLAGVRNTVDVGAVEWNVDYPSLLSPRMRSARRVTVHGANF